MSGATVSHFRPEAQTPLFSNWATTAPPPSMWQGRSATQASCSDVAPGHDAQDSFYKTRNLEHALHMGLWNQTGETERSWSELTCQS